MTNKQPKTFGELVPGDVVMLLSGHSSREFSDAVMIIGVQDDAHHSYVRKYTLLQMISPKPGGPYYFHPPHRPGVVWQLEWFNHIAISDKIIIAIRT